MNALMRDAVVPGLMLFTMANFFAVVTGGEGGNGGRPRSVLRTRSALSCIMASSWEMIEVTWGGTYISCL